MIELRKSTFAQKIKSFPALGYGPASYKDSTRKNMSVKISTKLSSLVSQKNSSTSKNQTIFSQTTKRYGCFREQMSNQRWSSMKQNDRQTNKKSHREKEHQEFRIRSKLTIEPRSGNTDRSFIKNEGSCVLERPRKYRGNVIAFGAKSHVGLKNSSNQNRIYVATSMKNNTETLNDLSFFGIFIGKNGITKAEYYRDNFYKQLSTDPLLFKDPEKTLMKTYQIIEKEYQIQELVNADYSSVSFIILIFVNLVRKSHKKDEAYLFQLGENQAFFSTNFGENIEKSFNKKYENFHEAAGFSSILEYHKMQNSKSHNKPFIEKISDCQLIDFIVIASSDFFQKNKEEKVVKEIWKYLLASDKNTKISKTDNELNNWKEVLHQKIGSIAQKMVSDKLMNEGVGNFSLVVVGLKNLQDCFETQWNGFQLPFSDRTIQ